MLLTAVHFTFSTGCFHSREPLRQALMTAQPDVMFDHVHQRAAFTALRLSQLQCVRGKRVQKVLPWMASR